MHQVLIWFGQLETSNMMAVQCQCCLLQSPSATVLYTLKCYFNNARKVSLQWSNTKWWKHLSPFEEAKNYQANEGQQKLVLQACLYTCLYTNPKPKTLVCHSAHLRVCCCLAMSRGSCRQQRCTVTDLLVGQLQKQCWHRMMNTKLCCSEMALPTVIC